MFDLNQKITVITGAGSGIGKAIALLFARQNATVFLMYLNAQSLEEVKDEITAQ